MALCPSLKYDHSYGRKLKPYLPKESKEVIEEVKAKKKKRKKRKKPERNPQHRIKDVDPEDFLQ